MDNNSNSSRLTRRTLLSRLGALALSVAATPALAQTRAPWNRDYELAVDFTINQPEGGRYHRPYVAVWVEDGAGNPVRTLALWVQTRKPGPRWIPDLKRWYRREKSRKVQSGGDLIETISVATRKPGQYSLLWNGRNDDGKMVAQGDYFVNIEAAREDGTYGILRQPVSVASRPFAANFGGNVEIKGARVEYRKR